MEGKDIVSIGLAQIAPVWLNRTGTIRKICDYINDAGDRQCDLVVFGEALLPGYPLWVELTNGARFNSTMQKELYAHYVKNAVSLSDGDLDDICQVCREKQIAAYLGCIERAADRGGHSVYCTLVYIDKGGQIQSAHRKLQPTYEERLVWSPGDGHGLKVHALENFTVGGLNCWENWMPLSRTALYAQGEDLHVAVWPGSKHNTEDITRFMAKEGRSFAVSVSGLMSKQDFPPDTPYVEEILANAPEVSTNGGSCIAGPDGQWVIPPIVGEEGLFIGEVNFNRVLEERQNFDPVGHYSRPDVTQLTVNSARQSLARFE